MPRRRWTNWAGNETCECDVETPASLDELRDVVGRAAADGKRVRATGGGYSWSPLVRTDGVIVDMTRFDHIRLLEPAPRDGGVRILEVGAGVTIERLDLFARQQGLTLVSPPLFTRPTLGGAVSVGCHGTGFATGNFCDQLREIHFVRADGSEHSIEQGHPEFPAAMVALGALGIVHEAKVEVVPQFSVYVDKRYVPKDYVVDEMDDLVRSCEYLEIFWFPFSRKMWLYIMNTTNSPPDHRWGWTRLRDRFDRSVESVAANHLLPWVAWSMPRLTPFLNRTASKLANQVNASVQAASDAFHFLRTYPRNFDLCYCVPVRHAGEAWKRAITLLDEYTRADLYPVNLALHCRFTAGSRAWLAPDYGRESCYIEVTTVTRTPEWRPFFQELEARWAELPGARPHWGKLFLRCHDLRGRYSQMERFLDVRDKWDPGRVFLNHFLEQVVFQLAPPSATRAAPGARPSAAVPVPPPPL